MATDIQQPYEYVADISARASYVEVIAELNPPRIFLRYDPSTTSFFRGVYTKLDELSARLDRITTLMEAAGTEVSRLEFEAEVTLDSVMTDIRSYLAAAGDNIIYPSDLTAQFCIAYDDAVHALTMLETEGKVEKA